MKKVACVIALAGTTLSLGTALTSASASPESVTSNGLRLSIPNAKIFTNEFTTTVDMQFRGGDIRALELFVDGALLKKQELNTQSGRGVVSFALDGLADGVHTVLVRSQDLAGNWVTTSAKFKVAPAPESTLARALYPMRGQMVQGVVPIKVELSDTIRNPYVSFSIDDEFMAIMNGGPFAYAWDSAKASNGLHTITADIFDDVAKIKTLKIQINVNNAGGFTNIQREPVAPSTPANTNNLVSETIAKFSSPTSDLQLSGSLGSLARAATDLSTTNMLVGRAPAGRDFRTNGKFTLPRTGFALRPDTRPLTNTPKQYLASSTPGVIGLLSSPVNIARLMDTGSVNIASTPLPLRSISNIAYRPGITKLTLGAVRELRGFTPANIAKRGAFAVFFNSTLVSFDVPTRVENGIALAPFRHLFEFAGGTVNWESETKTVTATKVGQEIKFVIGDKEARVNNKPIQMDKASYIDNGRSIVPLSFIGNILNVEVSYDKTTGRVLIESKKYANH
ncbi:hypothetical protein LBMAG21_09020 [Armatimonadota bacterium]|nr:hypothetical protein LBMAG21_09020 [Armatimonadota bacterium]